MKLGRNEICWCGSGKKYKKCHLNRDRQKPIGIGEAYKATKDLKSNRYCSVPKALKDKCTNKIINAHTVSKSSSLAEIVDDTNHVLGLKVSMSALTKNGGVILPEKTGINQASTFKGFCSYHDKSLFSCIEDEEFSKTNEQLFALVYRAVCKELYAKNSNTQISELLKNADKGKSIINQIAIQKMASDFGLGTDTALNELNDFKALLDESLVNNTALDMCHLVVSSSSPCPVSVSSILAPDVDFEGKQIQDLSNLKVVPECVIFNSFSSDGNGYIVFSWLKSSLIINSFIETLVSQRIDSVFNAILRFFFSVSENIYISPVWWESLTEELQGILTKRIMIGVTPFVPRDDGYLTDDGYVFNGWTINSIEKINF